MCLSGNLVKVDRNLLFYAYQPLSGITRCPSGIILFWKFFVLEITFVRSGLCIPNMVYLVQFVCLSDGVNLKVVATSIAEINRLVHHDVQNSMPLPICGGGDLGYNSLPSCMGEHMLYLGELAAVGSSFFLSVCFLSWEAFFSFFNAASEFVVFLMCSQNNDEHE